MACVDVLNAGPMHTLRKRVSTVCEMPTSVSINRSTTNWIAVCGRTAPTVWRKGRTAQPFFPTPIGVLLPRFSTARPQASMERKTGSSVLPSGVNEYSTFGGISRKSLRSTTPSSSSSRSCFDSVRAEMLPSKRVNSPNRLVSVIR